MNIYTCTEFTGHYPTGTAAIVVARSRAQAVSKLNAALKEAGLPGDAETKDLVPLIIDDDCPVCRILADGNY
jgi:hypothetical protein